MTVPLLNTKLHRPPIDRNHVHRPHLLARLDQHRDRPLTLVSAPAGYGKSVLISSWLEACEDPGAWLSLDQSDSDLRTFLTYFVASVETIFPEACPNTKSLLDAIDLPPLEVLGTCLLNELDGIRQFLILVLDDYYLIKEIAVHNLITQILKNPPQFFRLVIIGRLDPPLPISKLRAQSQLTEIRAEDLCFLAAEAETLLKRLLGVQINKTTVAALVKKTEGWVTGLRLAALSMRQRADIDPKILEPHVDAQYVMEYFFNEVLTHQPPEIRQYLLGSAILDRFCGPLCEAVCVPGVEPFTCEMGGWEFIAWLKKENLFVIPLDHANQWYRYHHLFRKLLVSQIKRHCSADEIKALHAQASGWFAENGLLEEAIRHALASGNTEAAGSMISRFSHRLIDNQQWVHLASCLYQLADEQIKQDPALLVLEAWIQLGRHNFSGVVDCVKRIEALAVNSSPNTLVNVEHVPGQLEVFKGAMHYIAAEGEKALACIKRSLKKIPSQHKRAHLLAHTGQILAHQMIGELETGLSVYQKAMDRHISRDHNYHAMFLGKLGLAYWVDADLNALQRTAESILKVAKKAPQSAISPFYGLYFMGIIHYHRNELQSAEERLASVVKAHYAASPINFAHSAFALALTYQAQKKPDRAREVSKSVVVDSIETNNSDMLQVARGFEAELALRQECLAEASRWVEKYDAKPFLPTFRFYMPQLTAAKIWLAQDTTGSRRQAAELLSQLHEFLESIHNNRFRIDTLAIQALLHNARGEDSIALKKLSAALNLAEPGGLIRPFVDLGPRVADLLKQLIKQNVAIGYIKRILDAFSEDEQLGFLPNLLDPMDSSPHRRSSASGSDFRIPTSAFHTSQPLVEPLTNRELEILELLGHRMQNKEIGDKLFISPKTVKKHLDNMYGKLNVSNRHQAVEKAQMLGILKR